LLLVRAESAGWHLPLPRRQGVAPLLPSTLAT
jgi:hypothetical protein